MTGNHSRKTRRPSETVASCEGPEPMNERRGAGLGRAGERRKSAKQKQNRYRRDVENGVDLVGERRKKYCQERIGTVDVDPEEQDKYKGKSARRAGLK